MQRSAKVCIAVTLVLLASTTRSSAKDDTKRLVEASGFYLEKSNGQLEWIRPNSRSLEYPRDGVSLGQGWDSLRETKVPGQCIEFTAEEAGGQVAQIQTKRIFDSDSLRHSVSLSYSASASATFGLGGGEGSAKRTFVSSSEVNHQHLNLLVKGEVQNGVLFASPAKTSKGVIQLTAVASKLLKKSRSEFLSYCGDSFVGSIERGAELYALYQFSNAKRAKEESKSSFLSVSANYMGFSGSGSTSETSTRNVVFENQVTGLKYFHSAHRGLRLAYNEESIYNALASLGSAQELSDAQPYRIKVTRYDSMPGWSEKKLDSGSATREALVAFYMRLSDLREIVLDIERDRDRYVLERTADLINASLLKNALEKRIAEVSAILEACETQKREASDEKTRSAAVMQCTTIKQDIAYSDYPYRALMPVEQANFTRVSSEKQSLEKRRDQLNAALDALAFRVPGRDFSCREAGARVPDHYPHCAEFARELVEVEKRLTVIEKTDAIRQTAEGRYSRWIKAIARARSEDGLIDGYLSPSELAMYRREIYCQYGVSPDHLPCPKTFLSRLLLEGPVFKKTIQTTLNISGDKKDTATAAWQDLLEKEVSEIAKLAKDNPHYYELVDPRYEETVDPAAATGPAALKLKSRVRITYFENDAEALAKVLGVKPRTVSK